MKNSQTASSIQEKISLKIVPLTLIAVGGLFFMFAALLMVDQFLPKNDVAITPLKAGTYVPAQVVFKVKPGQDPNAIVSSTLQTTQTLYRSTTSPSTLLPAYDSAVKQNPSAYTKTTLKLTKKSIQRVFADPQLSTEVRDKILRRNNAQDPATTFSQLGLDRWYSLEVNQASADIPTLVAQVKTNKGIETVGANGIAKAFSLIEENPPLTGGGGGGSTTTSGCTNPNDPYSCAIGDLSSYRSSLSDQYGIAATNIRSAWATTSGMPTTIIAVIDSGVNFQHPELSSKMWINSAEDINANGCADYWPTTETHMDCHGVMKTGDVNQIDDDRNGYFDDVNGMSLIEGQDDFMHNAQEGPSDKNVHGTAVSSVIAATTNNLSGMAGVCPQCTIMPIRAMDIGGTDVSVSRALLYALYSGADVVNMSLGSPNTVDFPLLRQALQQAVQAGLPIIAATGNDNGSIDSGFGTLPASYSGVIAVGAVDSYGSRWKEPGSTTLGSSWGNNLSVTAPGVEILAGRAHQFSKDGFSSVIDCFAPVVNGTCPVNGSKIRGTFNVLAVKAPGFGDRRKDMLKDIATVTGGQVITEELGLKLDGTTIEQLGKARKVIATKDNTTIVDGAGDKKMIEARIAEIRTELDNTDSDFDKEKLQERLAKLAGGVAILKVGGATETEIKEKKLRIEDAIQATKAAVEEGIVAGGGVALLRGIAALDHLKLQNEDEMVAVKILRSALEAPLRQIALNAGKEPSVIVNYVKKESGNYGYNAAKDTFEDLVAVGIVDPTKVTRTALQNAASITALMLTTEAIVTDKPEEKKDSMPGGGMPGGMGGMGGGMGMDY